MVMDNFSKKIFEASNKNQKKTILFNNTINKKTIKFLKFLIIKIIKNVIFSNQIMLMKNLCKICKKITKFSINCL